MPETAVKESNIAKKICTFTTYFHKNSLNKNYFVCYFLK